MINCIVAVEQGQGIGFNGLMPWPRLKGDMAWFKNLTTDHVVIMGSVTWHSLGKKLPNRVNVVLSRAELFADADHTFVDPSVALSFCQNEYPDKEIFIMGGQAIYDQYLTSINRFYITEINASYQCDKFFNLDYVKKHFPYVKEQLVDTDAVPYTMKEYNK